MSPRPQLSMSSAEIIGFLEGAHTGVLSTVGPHGFPHSVGIFYIPVMRETLELHMWVYAKSQKARNIERRSEASVLVEQGEPYSDLRGVLVSGHARIVRDPEAVLDLGKSIYERYFFPRTRVGLDDGPIANIERQARKRVNIVLSASRFASWDHGKGRDTITDGGLG